MNARRWRQLHLSLTIVWSVFAVPYMIFLRDSIPLIGFMSVYAIIATHFGGYQGARAEVAGEDGRA